MKAAVLHQYKAPLVIEEVTLDAPAADELLIRTVASGICHSDISVYEGAFSFIALPIVLGHEAAGIVEKVGERVTAFAPGDHVVTTPSATCGRCEWCIKGRPYRCVDKGAARPAGAPPRLHNQRGAMAQFTGLGGFAEQMLTSQNAAVKVPDDMPLDRAALLGCGVITGLGAALNTARPEPGSKIAVIGLGGVGLSALQAASFSSPRCLIAIDTAAGKLELARSFGATHVINAREEDPVVAVLRLTGDGLDHAFEAVGSPSTIEQAFAMLREGGTATVIGYPSSDAKVTIPAQALLTERTLQGSRMGSNRFRLDVPLYASLYLDGRLKLDELLSRTIALEDINDAIASFGDVDRSFARTVITF